MDCWLIESRAAGLLCSESHYSGYLELLCTVGKKERDWKSSVGSGSHSNNGTHKAFVDPVHTHDSTVELLRREEEEEEEDDESEGGGGGGYQ